MGFNYQSSKTSQSKVLQEVHCKSFMSGRTTGLWQHVSKFKWLLYDSNYSFLDQTSAATRQSLFRCSLSIVPIQKQMGGSDGDLFAIANATAIAFGRDQARKCVSVRSPTMNEQQ